MFDARMAWLSLIVSRPGTTVSSETPMVSARAAHSRGRYGLASSSSRQSSLRPWTHRGQTPSA